jgi:hypothetical protein
MSIMDLMSDPDAMDEFSQLLEGKVNQSRLLLLLRLRAGLWMRATGIQAVRIS